MMRSKRLQPIVSHARQLEQEAAQLFAEAQQRVVANEQQLQQLLVFREEYLGKGQQAQVGASVSRLLDYQAFLAKLSVGIGQAYQVIENSKHQSEVARQNWLKKRARCQALDKVVEKYQHQEIKLSERREQQEQEEFTRQRLFVPHT